jgi:hypothetical protein
MTNYQIVLGLLLEGQPVIIPFISGSDPVIGKYQLGLQDFATTPSCAAGRMIREQQKVFVGDRRGLRHENGRVVHFGGSAMLEALAFSFQTTF